MKTNVCANVTSRLVLAGLITAVAAETNAGEYRFEVGFGFDRSETSVTDEGFATINPGPGFPSFSADTESSGFELSGTWFFEGLSDERGPRSRAAFVDRASSVSVLIGDTSSDTDTVFRVPNGTPPEIRDSFETDGNSFAFAGRYVFDSSGWFVTGEVGRLEFDSFGASAEADILGAGVGFYVGDTTTVELSAARAEVDISNGGDDSETGLALTFDHIGGDPSGLQYGVAATVSNESIEGSSGSYSVRGSLYPTRDLTFNIDINGQLGSDPLDATVFSVGAGWFFSESFEVSGAVVFTNFDEPENLSLDDDGFRLAARYRF